MPQQLTLCTYWLIRCKTLLAFLKKPGQNSLTGKSEHAPLNSITWHPIVPPKCSVNICHWNKENLQLTSIHLFLPKMPIKLASPPSMLECGLARMWTFVKTLDVFTKRELGWHSQVRCTQTCPPSLLSHHTAEKP